MSGTVTPPSNDPLAPLVAAYRAENPASALDTRAVRRRVLAVATRGQLQRARRMRWLVPLAAVLAGGTAVAASAPARNGVSSLLDYLSAVATPATPPVGAAERSSSKPAAAARAIRLGSEPPRPAAFPSPSTTTAARPVSSALPSSRAADGAPSHDRSARSPAAAPPSARELTAPPALPNQAAFPPQQDAHTNADLSAYHTAHRLHFANGDFARALFAWNDYLARFPAGTFAPEARLNRAVCLARLGRTTEARAALSAIHEGRYGENGRVQARRLLDELTETP